METGYHRKVEVTDGSDDQTSKVLKTALTIWRLLFALGSAVVLITGFVFGMRADINSMNRDNVRQDQAMEDIRNKDERYFSRVEATQQKILDAINDLKLQLKDKQDRNTKIKD